MKIQEFGDRENPTVLLIEDGHAPIQALEKIFCDYFLIVAAYEEDAEEECAQALMRYVAERCEDHISILCSTAGGWRLARRLMENHIPCEKSFIEAVFEQAGLMILPMLETTAATLPQKQTAKRRRMEA